MNAFDANIQLLDSAIKAATRCQLCQVFGHEALACPELEKLLQPLDRGSNSLLGFAIIGLSSFVVGLVVGRLWF